MAVAMCVTLLLFFSLPLSVQSNPDVEEHHYANDPAADLSHQMDSQNQLGPHDVEQMVHGTGDEHHTSSEADDVAEDDVRKEFGVVDVEHIMHGSEDAHNPKGEEESGSQGREFQAGNVEDMVHGQDHVHSDTGQGQAQAQGPYSAGEEGMLKVAPFNVHDPSQRARIATAGDLSAFMGGQRGEEKGGGSPSVVDSEHLMHGAGGHDHDVRQLRDFKPKEDAQAKDPFSDVHGLLMHDTSKDDGDDHKNEDNKIHRGKTITYKDIMELGLDEDSLKGIDFKKLLQENAREYDDWQRDKQTIKGESPEGSFWEQLGELRRRYLSFGRNDGPARDLTGSKLDPAQQRWVSEMEGEGERREGEDSILHEMEMLGSTAPKQRRHKQHHKDNDHPTGRDVTDL